MREIRLLIVPYELGGLRHGVGRGPERLLEFGVEKELGRCGASVRSEVLELRGSFSNEVAACFELMRMVSTRVADATRDDAFPVVLSGSCFAAVGVVAGLAEPSPGVLWFDAHGDFHTPETSLSGYIDGMGLPIVTGAAWQALHATVPGARPVPETAIVHAGGRDFDEPEVRRFEASAVTRVEPESLRYAEPLLLALAALEPSPSGLYLHVDLDVLDSREAQANAYSVPGGPTAAQLESLVSVVLTRCPVRAASLTAYDPECDPDDRVPPIVLRLLALIAEYVQRAEP
jgi:arginase